MTDAQYGEIKATFKRWAKHVEYAAKRLAIDPDDAFVRGMACGLASAMVETKQCGDAADFVFTAVAKAKKKYRKEV